MTASEITPSHFWRLLETAISDSDGSCDSKRAELIKTLESRAPEEIPQISRVLQELLALADRWDLRAADKILHDESSDESFLEFRSWLILQGKLVFESVLDEPESLVEIVESESRTTPISDVPAMAYTNKTGEPMPEPEFLESVTIGEEWIESELPELFPRLWEEFTEETLED